MERQASASSLSVTTSRRMVDLHAVIAARNNADWYETMFQVHGLAYTRGRSTFVTDAPPPRFHSHMLAFDPRCSPATLKKIETQSIKEDFGIKDAFDAYDLAPLGLSPLFEARWIWADRLPVQDTADWSKVTNADQLLAFETAWNDGHVPKARHFPDAMLDRPEIAFWTRSISGRVVAGAIANLSEDCVGLSNCFGPGAIVVGSHLAAAFGGWRPVVGYERGEDLETALEAGFSDAGPLKVWTK